MIAPDKVPVIAPMAELDIGVPGVSEEDIVSEVEDEEGEVDARFAVSEVPVVPFALWGVDDFDDDFDSTPADCDMGVVLNTAVGPLLLLAVPVGAPVLLADDGSGSPTPMRL